MCTRARRRGPSLMHACSCVVVRARWPHMCAGACGLGVRARDRDSTKLHRLETLSKHQMIDMEPATATTRSRSQPLQLLQHVGGRHRSSCLGMFLQRHGALHFLAFQGPGRAAGAGSPRRAARSSSAGWSGPPRPATESKHKPPLPNIEQNFAQH